MSVKKIFNVVFSFLLIASTILGPNTNVQAMPAGPSDATKVPHYFGPWPNWANSQYTLPDASVTILGNGSNAAATATIGGDGAITGINVVDPGIGYTSATVRIDSANGTGATATAQVTLSGIVTSIRVDAQGGGYTRPTVRLDGGGGTGTLRQVGNQVTARAFATDEAAAAGTLAPVFVVVQTSMPASGTVQGIQYYNQATPGSGSMISAGNLFHAYVLRPTGNPNEYTVRWDSGELTVPTTADPVGEVVTIPVPNVPVTTGDAIAFYGQGIPVDDGTGTDTFSAPAPAAPVLNGVVALGSAGFPIASQTRTYSFAASVVDTSAVVALTNATASAYGGVDEVAVVDGGSGYQMPTIDFDMPDDPNGTQAKAHASMDANGTITEILVDDPGSGYAAAPKVVIRDGTIFDPINNGGSGATATATLKITSVTVETYGAGYTSAPSVTINDPSGLGANAVASVSAGGVTSITVNQPGSGYVTAGGIKKFQDGLPQLCIPSPGQTFADCGDNNLGQHIPVAVADTQTYSRASGFSDDADYFVIAVVQHRERLSSSLPASGTLLREYVQLETPANTSFSKHVPLMNDMLTGDPVPALLPNGQQAYAVDDPHYLGPVIMATKDRPVRIVFYNLLPTGVEGDLFLPVDSSMMGSGMGPMGMAAPADLGQTTDMVRNPECTEFPKSDMCFKDNRATLHLHGGITPWISDGTPHQWITPANEMTAWPQGVSVSEVPDMNLPGQPSCTGDKDGCMTFYYTNQQSARLMFYHDHAWGITRLNVFAGEAAGYMITDDTEKRLISSGILPADQIPLIIQDRTFVPSDAQLYDTTDAGGHTLTYGQDPTWDKARWGGEGNLWYHHVYMPAQNPGDPSGMSAYGRWMYGPWFWPPAKNAVHGPIENPYYDPGCSLDDPTTWQYQTDPFCEPKLIPGTPNISVGMEQFNDTPLVNGTAYPTTTVQPKAYRMRILNAANDRFWNLQWYVADPRTASTSRNQNGEVTGGTEVALNPAEVAAAQTDPNVFPTPDTKWSPAGPSWIQIGTEGGFLPAPVVVPNQPITWITDPTRFDVGNVDQHALLLAPAERADVIVDFSKYPGQTLILYNDAPAAFPARVASYDYYTGAPDLSPAGAPSILPGYGPNTRTIMQVKVAEAAPADAYNLTALQNAFKHKADGSGVFESGQHPIIVGQAAYNSAYGTNFASSSWCNAPGSTSTRCDGMARISEQGGDLFSFNTLRSPNSKLSIPLQPKAIHDEMNAASFDEYGRMTANLGVEAVPANPAAQNVVLYPYVNPSTELIDATNLPKGDVNVTPITTADGSQIWKITHNGVDTHPIHFHLYDVQVLNRVTWDNIIIPPDATELGWKDTVRISPLEDTIVALRPIIPTLPWELPNSIRMLNPMMPAGDTSMFNPVDANGNPTANIVNQLVNFGWEYVYHCHILSHEEMDMMRPVSVAIPPIAPNGLAFTVTGTGNNTRLILSWNDNSINETSFTVQRRAGTGPWTDLGSVLSPLADPNTHGVRTFTDATFRVSSTIYSYRVVAKNTIGYGGSFMSLTAQSVSPEIPALMPPTNLVATLASGPQVNLLFVDNAANETGFIVERATNGGTFAQIGTLPARTNTGSVSYADTTITLDNSYTYRVAAVNGTTTSAYSNTATIGVNVPAAPSNLNVSTVRVSTTAERATLTWTDNANNETGFTVQWAATADFANPRSATVPADTTTYTTGNIARQGWYFRVRANNVLGSSAWVTTTQVPAATVAPVNGAQLPLVFMNTFTTNLTGWTGQTGSVQVTSGSAMAGTTQGLAVTVGAAGNAAQAASGLDAYVYDQTPDALGSYAANFFFNPNGTVTAGSPVDIFMALDATREDIFGVQYRHSAATPGLYEVRLWARGPEEEIYSAWVPVANAEQNLQIDWQSDTNNFVNLIIEGQPVAHIITDTSKYKVDEVRLGAARGLEGDTTGMSGTLYFDEFLSFGAPDPIPPFKVFISGLSR